MGPEGGPLEYSLSKKRKTKVKIFGARRGGGPLMMMKDSLFLLISNVFGKECLAGLGAH